MSLSLALNSALTGLRTNQNQLSILSHNIANANTEGYSRQIGNQSPIYLNNVGVGVKIDEVSRNIDRYLQRTTQGQLSQVGKSGIISEYMSRVQLALSEPTSGTTLNSQIDSFFTAFQDLADNPERVSIRESTLSSAQSLTRNISSLAGDLQDLRYEADQDIYRGVQNVNQYIRELYDLNIAISTADAFGQNLSGLLDRRDVLLKNISEYVDTNVRYLEGGKVQVYAAGGTPLVDYELHELRYVPAQSMDAFVKNTTLGQITSVPIDRNGNQTGQASVLVDYSAPGVVPTAMQKGKLRGLLEIRDAIIPDYLSTLDELAGTFRDQFNALHNMGTGFPPPAQLNGQTLVDPYELRGWLGEFRLAVLNADGTALPNPFNVTPPNVERGGYRPMTLALAFDSGEGAPGKHEMQTIIDEINNYFGPKFNEVHLNNINDIKLVSMVENSPAGTNFRFDLDLDNIASSGSRVSLLGVNVVNGTAGALPAGTVDVAPGSRIRTGGDFAFNVTSTGGVMQIELDVQVEDINTGTIETATIRYTVDPAAVGIKNDRYNAAAVVAGTAAIELAINPNRVAHAELVDADGNPVAAGMPGYLKIVTENENYRLSIDELTSKDNGRLFDTPPLLGTQRGFSHFFGLNNFFNENRPSPDVVIDNFRDLMPGSAYHFSVREDIIQHANYISTGIMQRTIQTGLPSSSPSYDYELARGSKVVAQKLADLGLQLIDFNESGMLPVTKQSISSFGSSFLGAASAGATFAKQTLDQDSFLLAGYQERADAISGVNLDEEMGNTIIFQNAYGATARIITTVQQMFEALLSAV